MPNGVATDRPLGGNGFSVEPNKFHSGSRKGTLCTRDRVSGPPESGIKSNLRGNTDDFLSVPALSVDHHSGLNRYRDIAGMGVMPTPRNSSDCATTTRCG